ncbi:hypothetical protein SERLADRAFT_415522 [Serpula lacrymans var. lacrymans S7.9]|uniref:J domain-containing protein n=1 Tax=Serpula lacrymans var. lacrymans (strain S7.9) TaxID=578457 RepID=F8NWR4_SERL9|nr:uncharacterized protein SERLADRAFT_415522 [Serpula lacrymans var. lacrymans S7.9]EGO24416.1 hypothetical protein SERLADRAFT_415522 [Serpula lacrymans var. lacrymans S7.9]
MSHPPGLEKNDRYVVLGLSPDATDDEIRSAYKKLALKWHPDRHTVDKEHAAQMFIEVNAAYRALMDGKETIHSKLAEDTAKSASGSDGHSTHSSSKHETHSKSSAGKEHETSSDTSASPKPDSEFVRTPVVNTFILPTRWTIIRRGVQVLAAITGVRTPRRRLHLVHTLRRTKILTHLHHTLILVLHQLLLLLSLGHPFAPRHLVHAEYYKRLKLLQACDPADFATAQIISFWFRRKLSKGKPKTPKRRKAEDGSDSEDEGAPVYGSPLRPLTSPRGSSKEWIFPLPLTLDDMYHGTNFRFRIIREMLSRQKKEVEIEIDIPPGCRSGTRIVCPGTGHERKDGTLQDVVFLVEEVSHDRFSRVKDDLFLDICVPWVDSLADQGGELCVEGINGEEIMFSLPYPLQDQATEGKIIIKRAGMPVFHTGKTKGRGDLIIRWQVVFSNPSKWQSLKKVFHLKA